MTTTTINSTIIQLKDIHTISGALNIEGGFPAMDLKKSKDNSNNNNKLWVNLILVLDRPLIDNIVFDDIFKNNKYPLLENAIEELNEHKFMAINLMFLGYYIENCQKFMNKKEVSMLVYIHQDVHSVALINIIKRQLKDLIEYFKLDTSNITIKYTTDTGSYVTTKNNYDDTDIVISLSQCAGLDAKLEAGAMIVADQFIPYEIDTKTIHVSKTYKVENHALVELDNVINSKFNEFATHYITDKYISYNNKKNSNIQLKKLTRADFHITKVLQVDKLWNPKDDSESVVCA